MIRKNEDRSQGGSTNAPSQTPAKPTQAAPSTAPAKPAKATPSTTPAKPAKPAKAAPPETPAQRLAPRLTFDVPAPSPGALYDDAYLAELRGLGIRNLSLDVQYVMHNDTQDCHLLQLCQQLARHDIAVATVHPFFGSWNRNHSTMIQHPERRRYEIAWMREFIRRCGLLGVYAFPLHTGGGLLKGAPRTYMDIVERYVADILEQAEASDVIIALENTNHLGPQNFHPGTRAHTDTDPTDWHHDDPDKILEIVRRFGHAKVRVCFDIAHSHLQGEAFPVFRKFLPHIALYHLHDNGGDWEDSHLQPGYGTLDWAKVADLCLAGDPHAPCYIEAAPRHGKIPRALHELHALFEGRVPRDARGFYAKDILTDELVTRDALPHHLTTLDLAARPVGRVGGAPTQESGGAASGPEITESAGGASGPERAGGAGVAGGPKSDGGVSAASGPAPLDTDPTPGSLGPGDFLVVDLAGQAAEGMPPSDFAKLKARLQAHIAAADRPADRVLLLNGKSSGHAEGGGARDFPVRIDSPLIMKQLVLDLSLGGLVFDAELEFSRSRTHESFLVTRDTIRFLLPYPERFWYTQRPRAVPDNSREYLGRPYREWIEGLRVVSRSDLAVETLSRE